MVKMRDAGYCNLKFLLTFLVVYGHWIENSIYEFKFLLVQYRIIYMFHMPLFIFLSGLFMNSAKDCIHQIKRFLPIYVLCQTLALLCENVHKPDTPWWILWYLLSYCFWENSLTRLGMWSEDLWQDYEGCYFDTETKKYIYYDEQ